jgi:hypothetical protein
MQWSFVSLVEGHAMRHTLTPIFAALAVLLVAPAAAQTSAPKPTTKAPGKPAVKKRAPAAPAAEAPLAAAGAEQLEAANAAHLGDYDCEFDQKVTLEPYAKAPGYIEVKQKAQAWVMKPVMSSTGALRLEDVKGRMLMIQIANKSMVMDTKIGQRLVDGCVHEKQRAFIATQGSLLTTEPTKP